MYTGSLRLFIHGKDLSLNSSLLQVIVAESPEKHNIRSVFFMIRSFRRQFGTSLSFGQLANAFFPIRVEFPHIVTRFRLEQPSKA